MEAVILVAGCSKRMQTENFKGHKALLEVGNFSFLGRLLHQCLEYNISKIILVVGCKSKLIKEHVSNLGIDVNIVENPDYETDTNIRSMQLALKRISGESQILILEGDVYITDYGFKKISESFNNNNSTWITKGEFNKNLYGGILHEKDNIVDDIQIVESYSSKLSQYKKLTGIMTISKNQISLFLELINYYIKENINCYYLQPWIDNLKTLACLNLDINSDEVFSCNTYEEYEGLIKILNKESLSVSLERLENLVPIEKIISSRADYLFDKILNDQNWINPIVISKENNFIMDGHHRFEVAKKMKLKNIPVVKLEYDKVKIWSLRPEFNCNHETVKNNVLSGNLYPNKTVKHDFRINIPKCYFNLNQLN